MSVSTTPFRVTPPLGVRAPALTASTLPPLSVWPCLGGWIDDHRYKSGECQNSGFKAMNYVDLYCESDWDHVNDE